MRISKKDLKKAVIEFSFKTESYLFNRKIMQKNLRKNLLTSQKTSTFASLLKRKGIPSGV